MMGSELALSVWNVPVAERNCRIREFIDHGNFVEWPWVKVPIGTENTYIFARSDYFSIGEPNNFVRMPCTPATIQLLLERNTTYLPTRKLVDAIFEASIVKAHPRAWGPPYDAEMQSTRRYVQHNEKLSAEIGIMSFDGMLAAGHKKDVVVSPRRADARIAIYGWFQNLTPIQDLNFLSHDVTYEDYSHGFREIREYMVVNGQDRSLLEVGADPELCNLVSDEGIIQRFRYFGESTRKEVSNMFRIGDRGNRVRYWQDFLFAKDFRNAFGHKLMVDGSFGPNTEFATRTFQRSVGLPETGVVDDATLQRASTIDVRVPGTVIAVTQDVKISSMPNVIQIPSSKFTNANRKTVDLVVIHTMEAPEKANTAVAVSKWGASATGPKASWHYAVDNTTIVQCVPEEHVAWHAPGVNNNGIGIEHAGFANQKDAGWSDEYSTKMLVISAQLVAQICKRWNIPAVKLSAEDLKAKKRGICGHVDVTNGLNGGKGHWDPGPNFPWFKYIEMINAAMVNAVTQSEQS